MLLFIPHYLKYIFMPINAVHSDMKCPCKETHPIFILNNSHPGGMHSKVLYIHTDICFL